MIFGPSVNLRISREGQQGLQTIWRPLVEVCVDGGKNARFPVDGHRDPMTRNEIPARRDIKFLFPLSRASLQETPGQSRALLAIDPCLSRILRGLETGFRCRQTAFFSPPQ